MSLKERTSIGVGGIAAEYVSVDNISDLPEALATTLDTYILSGGTNCLISDHGFDGRIVQLDTSMISVTTTPNGDHQTTIVSAEAGMQWDDLVSKSVALGYCDLACLSGIPGRVGAAPIQNIGAYGQSVADSIYSVTAYNRLTKKFRTLKHNDCAFGYRDSMFKMQRQWIITDVCFHLKNKKTIPIIYTDLVADMSCTEHTKSKKTQAPKQNIISATAIQIRQSVLRVRAKKSMLINPKDPNAQSLGSFFKNPVVSQSLCDKLLMRYPDMPHYILNENSSTPDGSTKASSVAVSAKIPAAWLIEAAGYKRGHVAGKAGLSAKHALALINRGGATSTDIASLANDIYSTVASTFGIKLVPEVQFVGMAWKH